MTSSNLTPLARIALGGLAGLVATAPMSALMLTGKQLFTRLNRRPLPPTKITQNMLGALGLEQPRSHTSLATLTAVNHFGYGAGMGTIYGLSADTTARPTSYAVGQGVGFGIGVWTMSYLGWLPASGLYRPATREPLERNALMIAAHVVWGGAMGLLVQELARRARNGSVRNISPKKSVNPVGL